RDCRRNAARGVCPSGPRHRFSNRDGDRGQYPRRTCCASKSGHCWPSYARATHRARVVVLSCGHEVHHWLAEQTWGLSVRSFAILPAAGQSRRMGAPKLLLPWGETTLIGEVIRSWKDSRVDQVLVVIHP